MTDLHPLAQALTAMFDLQELEFCRTALTEYCHAKSESQWIGLLPRIEAQIALVHTLHALVDATLENALRPFPQRLVNLTGEALRHVKKQIKDVVREVERMLTNAAHEARPVGAIQEFAALPVEADALPPPSAEIEQIAPQLSAIEKLEAYFRAYFAYLDAHGYAVADINRLVWDVVFEVRSERGLRVQGVFVDRADGQGYVDDIVVLVNPGCGSITHGIVLDERMQRAVQNAFEAALRYVDEAPEAYNLSWQVRHVEHEYVGDSLGLPIAVSVVARLLQHTLPRDVALTGVVTKDGEVTAVGGIPAKVHAALAQGSPKS